MVAPKSLVFQLHRHWDVVEQLTLLSREYPAFELALLAKVINQYKSQDVDSNSVLSSLCNADVLQPISRSDDYQLNPLVLDFVRGLTQEHELGLSEVLKARVDAIKDATNQLLSGLENADNDLLRSGAQKLAELSRKIAQQLSQDKQAICEIAELAKAADTRIPIERRYREVLEAYDQYVEPMNQMMDSGLGGSFYPLLEAAERALDQAVDTLEVRGALYRQRVAMRQISFQVKELRYQGRITAAHCADTLLPLREEARQHNQLSVVISKQLSQVRKKGLARALKSGDLPLWVSSYSSKLQIGDEIRNVMADFLAFEPSAQPFPEDTTGVPTPTIAWIDEQQLRHKVARALPINNLMTWLTQQYPQLGDAELLRLYHELIREDLWHSRLDVQSTVTALNTIAVRYHPHRLSQEPQLHAAKEHNHAQ